MSSWRRTDDTMAPPRAKITGLYVNSALAKSEAVQNGYDEAILLSHDGHVSEGSAENIFIVRRGVLYTPDPSQNVLEGVTRRAIMEIAHHELGLEVVERSIDRGELYCAQEVFLTGTAVGICPRRVGRSPPRWRRRNGTDYQAAEQPLLENRYGAGAALSRVADAGLRVGADQGLGAGAATGSVSPVQYVKSGEVP